MASPIQRARWWWNRSGRYHFDIPFRWWQFRRAWRMVRADWSTSDGDWSTIAEPMMHAIRRTRVAMAESQIVVGWERDCKRMLMAETLLDRLLRDDYYDLAVSEYAPHGSSRWAHHVDYLGKQDQEMLGKIIGKYLRHWWY